MVSQEARQKMREAKLRNPTRYWLGKKRGPSPTKGKRNLFPTGEKSSSWKGESAGYSAKHKWISLNYGTPSKCERCETTTAKRYEWANISRTYIRERGDWERLCVNCHRNDGVKYGEYPEPWNKGTTGLMPTPWNKGLKMNL